MFNKKTEDLYDILFGSSSEVKKMDYNPLVRNLSINYPTTDASYPRDEFSVLTTDGILVSLIKKIKELENKVAILESKSKK